MTKSSKRTAIVMALITVALCAAVIAGATFALFSSSVTNDINVNTGDISVTGTLSLESAWSESEEGAREQGSVSGDSATVPQGGSVTVNPDSGAITFNNISMGDGAEFNLALNVTNTIRAKYCVELSVTNADNGSFLQDNLQITFDDAVADLSGETASLRGWTTLAANEGASDSVTFTISLPWTAEGADSAGSQSISLQLVTKAVQANASSGQNFETSDGSGYMNYIDALPKSLEANQIVARCNSNDQNGSLDPNVPDQREITLLTPERMSIPMADNYLPASYGLLFRQGDKLDMERAYSQFPRKNTSNDGSGFDFSLKVENIALDGSSAAISFARS